MTDWTYYEASRGVEHGSGGIVEGVLVLAACVALELLVVALAVGSASLQDFLAMTRSERRRAGCRRRGRVERRLAAFAELDIWLDQVWTTEVDVRRREAARKAATLISSQTPIVEIRCCRRRRGECCAQLTFADGTTLALWSSSPASEHKLHRLGHEVVLQWASPPDRGDLMFGAGGDAVLINGDLLAAGAP